MYDQIKKIFEIFSANNYQCYIVGGAVRDIVMGKEPHDYDFTTNALPHEVTELFMSYGYKVIPTGIKHGTVTVIIDYIPFEITTYRKDTLCDGRHCTIEFTPSLEEDIKRRDFTINALAMDKDNNIIDITNGLEDIENRIIRTVGDPYKRFTEDYLRILRAIRFAAKLNFEIDQLTYDAIKALYPNLTKISRERIRDEFTKILLSPYDHQFPFSGRIKGLVMLYDTNIIDIIIPDFSNLATIEQPPQFHPEGDVLTHTMLALRQTEDNDSLELILATLLHDFGKLFTYTYSKEKGRVVFYDHDIVGADKARDALRDLKYDNDTIDKVHFLISKHMYFHQNLKKLTIKKLMLIQTDDRYVFNPLFDDLMKLHKYDLIASQHSLDSYYKLLNVVNEIKEEISKEPPVRLITGYDIMALGIKPGPIISDIMEKVENAHLEGIIKTREEALEYLQRIIEQQKDTDIT